VRLAALLVAATAVLAGCEINSGAEAHTDRYLALTPSKVGRGKLAVMMGHKIQGRYPSPREARLLLLTENGFKSKGYEIVANPLGADYGLLLNLNQSAKSYSYDVYAGGISQRVFHTHSITARLYELGADGNPKDLLWRGFAVLSSSNPTFGRYDVELSSLLIDRFPN
jgi:hypothetical protein